MSDDFEDLLKRWLRDRAGNDRSALQALAGNVAALPPRRRRSPVVPLAAAAILVLVVGYVLVSARFGGVGSEATPSEPSQTTSSEATPDLVPVWAVNLASQLQCDGPPQTIGGEIRKFEPVGANGTASPWPWLYEEDVLDLPLEGWVEDQKVAWETGASDLMRYVYTVDGRLKAIIVMGGHSIDGGPGHWEIVALRACAPAEFSPMDARTTDDARWSTTDGGSTTAVRTEVGSLHCGWDSTVWLTLESPRRVYVRDPLGVLRSGSVGEYLGTTDMPGDASPTDLRSHDRELFTTPDQDFVYIRTPVGVERWPRLTDPGRGCA
jgi:hypothetical protein